MILRLRNFGQFVRINEEKVKLFNRINILYHCPYIFIDDQIDWQRDILGKYPYNNITYPVSPNRISFIYSNREELIEFLNAFVLLMKVLNIINKKKFAIITEELWPSINDNYNKCIKKWIDKDKELNVFLRKFTPTGMYTCIIHKCLAAFEKLNQYYQVVEIIQMLLSQTTYGWQYRPHWYIRASLICQRYLKDSNLAKTFCINGLNDEAIRHQHYYELEDRLSKLIKCQNEFLSDDCFKIISIKGCYNRFEGKNFFFEIINNELVKLSVEEVAIRHYTQGSPTTLAIHCESKIIHIFFGLFFWDIIYSMDYPDSFIYYEQDIPLDISFDDFYTRRKILIDKRLEEIENYNQEELMNKLIQLWNAHYNKASLLVKWDFILLEPLLVIFYFI